jgi:hypothetical protein
MSKRSERREADRAARKLACQQSHQQTPATAAAPDSEPVEDNTEAIPTSSPHSKKTTTTIYPPKRKAIGCEPAR